MGRIVKFEDAPAGVKLKPLSPHECGWFGKNAYIIKRPNDKRYDIFNDIDDKVDDCFHCFNGTEVEIIGEECTGVNFKVGDRVVITDKLHANYGVETVIAQWEMNGSDNGWCIGDQHNAVGLKDPRANVVAAHQMEIINDNKSGETKVNTEEFEYPQFVTIVKNTELLKKGGVFRKSGSYYEQEVDAYQAQAYSSTLRKEQVKVLIEKKVAVEAVRFNPEFVTLAQNEILQTALANSTKKPAAKKAVAKKASK